MPANFTAPRPFSATSQVHPSYLPALHKSGRIERRLATATVAAVGIGYGLAKYRAYQAEQWQQQQPPQSFHNAEASPAMVAAAADPQKEAVENAYGDRTTLAELEAAVVAYEHRRKS
ncbi:hypothetical protein F4820DRAFT_345004 [Hypoxylon rubiginosum]|uniref:Uncharacterized protein n=1 Tax=Hypoxylon rubiginosum TaxID=110542 RepID=A0ACB9YXL1_9PEZI|nr:hypothetical protein F4820DRAFT_345004 [Hypoxylon rubiginosum]